MTHWYKEPRKKARQTEHNLQTACVRWFRYTHPELALCLFAVPNGGARDATTGAMLKAEGATAGVADLLLLVPSHDGKYHALAIEMKTTEKGSVQRETQKQWQQAIEATGNRYVVVRDFDHFCAVICDHLGEEIPAGVQVPQPDQKTPTEGKKTARRTSIRTAAEGLQAIKTYQDTHPE